MNSSGKGHAKALTIIFLVVGVFIVAKIPSQVSAVTTSASPGEVYINPAVTADQAANTTFQVQVKVANMTAFNTYDIQVFADQSVISATNLTVTGNTFAVNSTGGTPFELVHCVNGVGTGCVSGKDGPGIVHSEFSLFGRNANVSGSGLLFTITYNVTSAKVYTPITMHNVIFAIAGVPLYPVIVDGSYFTAPDFSVAATPQSLIAYIGLSNATTVDLTSLHNFNGTVTLTGSSTGTGISLSFSQNQTKLIEHGSNSTILTVIVEPTAAATSYTLNVTAVSGSLTRFVLVPLIVHTPPDFEFGISPGQLLTPQSSTSSTTVFVTSYNGFTGTVRVDVQAPSGTTATFPQWKNSTTVLTVPINGSVNSTLTVTTQSSANPFRDEFNFTATSGPFVHDLFPGLVVIPPPPDFNVTTSLAYASIQAGGSESVAIGVTSVDYYVGSISLLGEAQTGLGFTFTPGSFNIAFGQTHSATIRIITNSTTAPGNHTLTLTVIGVSEISGASTEHSMVVTINVAAIPVTPLAVVKTFLGLQATQFYTMIGGVAAALAVLGLFEARRSKPRKSSILEG